MKIIKEPIEDVLSIIEEEKPVINPVKSIFVLETLIDGGYLLYNTLTQEIVFLEENEYKNMSDNEYLIKHCFFIRPNIDETKRVDELRKIFKLVKSDKTITGYTIFTTTDCNARCYYCFESKCSRRTMNEETANKVADFIIKNSNGQKCRLKWFGGEPLLNYKVINLIVNRLKEANVPFTSSMTTNGFLFDDETNAYLKEWNLKNVQITLDGTERNYNRIKAYIDVSISNPFEKVINNIVSLLNLGIHVDIRLNLSMINYEDMNDLVLFLNEKFSNATNLHVYTSLLFQEQDNEDHRQFLEEKEKDINALLADNFRSKNSEILDKFQYHFCQVDSQNSLTILPDGKLGLCEHFTDSHFIGDIDSGITDLEMVNKLREYKTNLPECSSCFYYPLCFRLKICDRANCNSAFAASKKNKMMQKIVAEYYNKAGNTR